jgi:pimeloyl-ACP methyl ester carboxylesterase
LYSDKSPKNFSPHLIPKVGSGTHRFILVNNFRIHYLEAGQGEPLILIPGSYNTRRTWNRLIPLLSAEFHLLSLNYLEDLTSSDPGDHLGISLQDQTDIIAKMVRQIGFPGVHLLGGFSGGAVCYDFAARYPDLVLKIVSIEGSLIQSNSDQTSPSKTCGVPKNALLPWFKLSRSKNLSIEEEAKSIKAPLLYLFGTKSDVRRINLKENLEYLKTYLPLAWVVSLEGSLNELSIQQPSEIANLILDFLRNKPAKKNSGQ